MPKSGNREVEDGGAERTTGKDVLMRVKEEQDIKGANRTNIDDIGMIDVAAIGNGPQRGMQSPDQMPVVKEMGGKEEQTLRGGDGNEGQMKKEGSIASRQGMEVGKDLPVIDGEAVLPGKNVRLFTSYFIFLSNASIIPEG